MTTLEMAVVIDAETIEKLPLRSNGDAIESAFKIDEHLARYYYLMEQEFKSLALSEEEFLLMCNVLNGNMVDREHLDLIYQSLPIDLATFIEFNGSDHDNVNVELLQGKITHSTLVQRFALVYTVERYLLSPELTS